MKKQRKQRKLTTFKEDVGKVLVDVSKLVFGSVVLGGVLRGELPQVMLVVGGFLAATVLCALGLRLASKEKEAGEDINSPMEGGK